MKSRFQIFSENLKTERIARFLSQKNMADLLGTTQPVYNRYEKGGKLQGREPDFEMLCKIAEVLDVSLDILFGLKD